MAEAGYTFLPWARRGLVAEITAPDDGGALPARATAPVTVTVENAGTGGVDVTMLGPGDVMGLDPRLIVRTEPRANATAFEPNYLAAIDFDFPDLPWLFTPAGPAGDQLRPWLVLVVVERQPGVSVGMERGSPLPVLRIDDPADATVELPDLAESAMWAHAQVLADATIAGAALADELAARPNANVSRLVCPRRLAPGREYLACVTPAFDAGRTRGLGGVPDDGAPLGPAWSDEHTVRLPVYHHWAFATGPDGDFESLAARLRPYGSSPRVGRTRMHIGDALPPVVDLPAGSAGSIVDMDGALRAPANPDLSTEEIDTAVRDGLRAVVNATSRRATGEAPEGERGVPAVGPPLYGEWHANRHTLDDAAAGWLVELNVDPRARVAAGLGAEVERANQEELMHAAWVQVGDVLEANRRLNAARLALEGARRVHARHLQPLAAGRLAALTAPLQGRTLIAGVAMTAAIRSTSLPDAAVDAALRRQSSSQRPVLRAAARRAGAGPLRATLVTRLAQGVAEVDPNGFVPDGILHMASLASLPAPGTADPSVSLAALGIAGGAVAGSELVAHRDRIARLAGADRRPLTVTVRDKVRSGGVIGAGRVLPLGRAPGRTPPPLIQPLRRRPGPETEPEPGPDLPPPVNERRVIQRLERATEIMVETLDLDAPIVRATPVAFDLGAARAALLERTDPDRTVLARVTAMIRVGGARFDPSGGSLQVSPAVDRVLAAPTFEWPASSLLARYDRARFCPGIDEVPPDSVTLLETNPRFVEAFLVGLNHEVNRELVWRSYPTDQRATTFRRFWDRLDDSDDIDGIHSFDAGRPLGAHLRDPRPKLVLLVRGELLRRYPTASVYAVRSTPAGRMSTDPADVAPPVFTGSFDPDLTYVGFDLEDTQLDEGDGWFFVLQEQPTEPRFGFDDPPRRTGVQPASWLEVAWSDLGVEQGAHLTPGALTAVGLGPVGHSGAAAAAMFQRPMRVAVHARRLVRT